MKNATPVIESPTPAMIRQTREAAELTGRAAAALIHTTDRVWRQYEAGDRAMHPAFWELFCLKIGRRAKRGTNTSQVANHH